MSVHVPTRVFISYSWDNDEHRERVLGLAQRLRKDGIDAWVDQFTPFAAQGWAAWMVDEINRASFVLCVITKNYAERFSRRSPRGVGRGVKWEGSIINDALYNDDGESRKFIPVFFDEADVEYTPPPLRGFSDRRFVLPEGYILVYRLLTGQPAVVPEPVGHRLELPPPAAPGTLLQPKVYRHRRDRGNLPRLPYFFGRDEELKIIEAALAPDVRTWIVLIDGPGGVGKTTLAIRAAELAPEDAYPRIVYASARIRELEPDGVQAVSDFRIDSYLDLLNSVARELGDDALAKLDEKERPAALRRLLRDRPALLVLDNLESLPREELMHVLHFLKHLPEGTKSIITSRRRTDIQAEIIRLGWMDWPAASELLNALARRYPPLQRVSERERVELYQNTAGNPLILRWVVGQLGREQGRCRTVRAALDLLRESPAGDEALEFIFGDLVDTFTAEEMKLLAALTHFTRPVEVKHIAELSDLGPLIAQDELENLADRALVQGDAESRHFILTPLVADFLRRKRPEVIRQSGDRLVAAVYAIAVECGNKWYTRFPLLEEAWPMIEAALLLLDYDKLQIVCDALSDFLSYTGRWDENIALIRLAEDKAVAECDFWKAGWRACQEAGLMFHRRNAEGVNAAADRATGYWEKINPSNYELGILSRRRGMAYELMEDYPAALDCYRKTLELWRQLPARSGDIIPRVLNDIANTERLMGNFESAERNYEEALRIAKRVGYAEGEATYTGSLADLALDRGRWAEAEKIARQALLLARGIRNRELIAVNYARIGEALAGQQRTPEGMPYAYRAVESLTALRSPQLARAEKTLREFEDAFRRLGIEYMRQNWPEEEQATLADLKHGDRLIEARALYEQGLILQGQGRHQDAEVRFRGALGIWQEGGRTIEEARLRNSLGWSLQSQKRWEDAEQCYQAALAICEEVDDPGERWLTEQNLARLNEERAASSAGAGGPAPDPAAAPAPDGKLFEPEVRAYEKQDRLSPPPQGAILFYGSSSIRFWSSLATDFPGYPVLNRGFGGARLRDCLYLYPRLVKPYSPKEVVLYAGDNDLVDNLSPQHILDTLLEFLDLISKDFSSTRVAFISIKPSPARRCLDKIAEINRLVQDQATRRDNLAYLNVYSKMLKPDGSPNEELFLDDELHMSPAGYEIWKEVVADYLAAVWPRPTRHV